MTIAVTTRQFYGAGGGGSKSPTQTADNLFSIDIVEALLGVSEGPIYGLAPGGAKNWYVGETPLINADGNQNFDAFELIVRKGTELGQNIQSRLGGFASSTTVQTELASRTPVVRQGRVTDIDYLDIRLAISRLLRSDDNGTFQHTGKVKIEYKPSKSTTWLPITTAKTNPPVEAFNGTDAEVYIRLDKDTLVSGATGDAICFWQATAPVVNSNLPTIWFDSSQLNRPKKYSNGRWVNYGSTTYTNNRWTFDRTYAFVATSAPSGRRKGDFWLNTAKNVVYFFNGSVWVLAGSTLSPGAFWGQGSTGGNTSVSAGEVTLVGKSSTTFVKELRIPVRRLSNDSYDIRVTKTSPENTTETFFDLQWESFQEVKATVFNFPALATAQLTARASDQFSSVPDLWGVYRGRIVKVPSNYDPEARTYRGLWDGTWKLAYTNNPAYIVADLVENDRYGMNAYYPVALNKYDIYEAGQWCDVRRKDGQPRFTFNGLISEPRGCREAVEYICGIFGGRFFDDGNGSATIKIDKDDRAIALFSPENVASGLFTYSFTEASSRYNDITVTFVNPSMLWAEDRRRVHDQNHIAKYGRIPLNFIAVGCTNVAEAIARARYKLATGINEKTIVNFRTNRAGLYLKPYEVILIADDDVGHGLSGRVKRVASSRTLELRDPIYLEAGVNYKISFQVPDTTTTGYKLVDLNLVTTPGNQLTLTTQSNLPTLPENAVFIITASSGTNPKPFRITKIDEAEGDPDNVEIQAIEIDRQKWQYVDGLIDKVENPPTYVLDIHKKPKPPFSLTITPEVSSRGRLRVHNFQLQWDASESTGVVKYKVHAARNNAPLTLVTETTGTSHEMLDLIPGEYVVSVTACGVQSESDPVYAEHRLIGDFRDNLDVTNLHLANEVGSVFTTPNPTFVWDEILTTDHEDFIVQIRTMNNQIVHETVVRQPTFTYGITTNKRDNGTPLRSFQFWVAARDQFGYTSPFAILSVSNPAPPVVVPTLQASIGACHMAWDMSAIPDAAGAKIWVSPVNNFAPNNSNLVYNGPGAALTRYGEAGTTYYLRIAIYDTFGDVDLNISPQFEYTPTALDLGALDGVFGEVTEFVIAEGEHNLAARLEDLQRQIDEANLSAGNGALSGWNDRQSLRRELTSTSALFREQINIGRQENESVAQRVLELEVFEGTANAKFVEIEEVRASDNQATALQLAQLLSRIGDTEAYMTSLGETLASEDLALAQDLNQLVARLGDAEALISDETVARVDAISSLAATQQTLTAQYGEMSAMGRVGFMVSAATAGVSARYAIVLRTGTTETYSEAGLYVDILEGGRSRVAVKADDFVLLNETGQIVTSPFYVSEGRAYMNNAFIRDLSAVNIDVDTLSALSADLGVVTAGRLQSANGKVVFDLNEGFLSMER